MVYEMAPGSQFLATGGRVFTALDFRGTRPPGNVCDDHSAGIGPITAAKQHHGKAASP
jgi:hypothetical protein